MEVVNRVSASEFALMRFASAVNRSIDRSDISPTNLVYK